MPLPAEADERGGGAAPDMLIHSRQRFFFELADIPAWGLQPCFVIGIMESLQLIPRRWLRGYCRDFETPRCFVRPAQSTGKQRPVVTRLVTGKGSNALNFTTCEAPLPAFIADISWLMPNIQRLPVMDRGQNIGGELAVKSSSIVVVNW